MAFAWVIVVNVDGLAAAAAIVGGSWEGGCDGSCTICYSKSYSRRGQRSTVVNTDRNFAKAVGGGMSSGGFGLGHICCRYCARWACLASHVHLEHLAATQVRYWLPGPLHIPESKAILSGRSSVVGGWWLVVGCWRSVVGRWWSVVGGRSLVVGGRS